MVFEWLDVVGFAAAGLGFGFMIGVYLSDRLNKATIAEQRKYIRDLEVKVFGDSYSGH